MLQRRAGLAPGPRTRTKSALQDSKRNAQIALGQGISWYLSPLDLNAGAASHRGSEGLANLESIPIFNPLRLATYASRFLGIYGNLFAAKKT